MLTKWKKLVRQKKILSENFTPPVAICYPNMMPIRKDSRLPNKLLFRAPKIPEFLTAKIEIFPRQEIETGKVLNDGNALFTEILPVPKMEKIDNDAKKSSAGSLKKKCTDFPLYFIDVDKSQNKSISKLGDSKEVS